MQSVYLKDLGGAESDRLQLYCPKKGADFKMHFSESHACFSQLAAGMIKSLPVDELSLSGILSQVNPCSHQFLQRQVIGIDEKQF